MIRVKHLQGQHNQSTHGRRSDYSTPENILESIGADLPDTGYRGKPNLMIDSTDTRLHGDNGAGASGGNIHLGKRASNGIKQLMQTGEINETTADALATVAHELGHVRSPHIGVMSKKGESYIEEGLVEHFARQNVEKQFLGIEALRIKRGIRNNEVESARHFFNDSELKELYKKPDNQRRFAVSRSVRNWAAAVILKVSKNPSLSQAIAKDIRDPIAIFMRPTKDYSSLGNVGSTRKMIQALSVMGGGLKTIDFRQYKEAYKHLTGRHDQKRHGWRFGGNGKGPAKDDPERAEFEARAGRRADYRERVQHAHANIAGKREGLAKSASEIAQVEKESEQLSAQYVKLTNIRNETYQKWAETMQARGRIYDRQSEIGDALYGKTTLRWNKDPEIVRQNREQMAAWREAHSKEVLKLELENKKLMREYGRLDKQAGKEQIIKDAADKEFRNFADGPDGVRMRQSWEQRDAYRKVDDAQIGDVLQQTAADRAFALKAGMRQAAVLRKSTLRKMQTLDVKVEKTEKAMYAAHEAYWTLVDKMRVAKTSGQITPELTRLSTEYDRATNAYQKAANQRSATVSASALSTKNKGSARPNIEVDLDGPSRVALGDGFEDFNLMVGRQPMINAYGGGKIGPIDPVRSTGGRAYAYDGGIYINRSSTRRSTVVHELGHILEDRDPFIGAAVKDFYTRRAGNEAVKKLNDIAWFEETKYPTIRIYADSEIGIKDKFIDEYMGKLYGNPGKPYATEILSMGLQLFFENPTRLMREDPEYFDFVFSVVRLGEVP